MMERIFGILLVFSLLLQSSITVLPLSFIILLLLYCYYRAEWVFIAAFISGICLDIFQVRPLGMTSIFFLVVLFLIFVYQRKFEIASPYFVFFAVFFGCSAYFFVFGLYAGVVTAFFLAVLSSSSFWLLKKIVQGKKHTHSLRWE